MEGEGKIEETTAASGPLYLKIQFLGKIEAMFWAELQAMPSFSREVIENVRYYQTAQNRYAVGGREGPIDTYKE